MSIGCLWDVHDISAVMIPDAAWCESVCRVALDAIGCVKPRALEPTWFSPAKLSLRPVVIAQQMDQKSNVMGTPLKSHEGG